MRTFVVTLAAALVLTGCGPDDREKAAASTAERFADAAQGDDAAAACAMLAPQTRRELEESSDAACVTALAEAELPDLGRAGEVQVYGHQAEVRGDGDTIFLADHDGRWQVIAAGCEPRTDRPYDCAVKGA